jgi:hypothetical protein
MRHQARELTDCLSYFFCSCRLTSIKAKSFCLFFSSCSSSCSFSFACCFLSISTRRFCAVEDELCARVPSRAPNNLFPRFRSSSFTLSSDLGVVFVSAAGGDEPLTRSREPYSDKRGRLLSTSDTEDCLRFESEGEGGCSTVSGKMTADATSLQIFLSGALVAKLLRGNRHTGYLHLTLRHSISLYKDVALWVGFLYKINRVIGITLKNRARYLLA